MTLRRVVGDLFDSNEPAIAHGVNCCGVMGAGIAAQFRDRYPEMYRAYADRCRAHQPIIGGMPKLVIGDIFPWGRINAPEPVVFNLATQEDPGRNAKLWAVMRTVESMLKVCDKAGIRSVGIPQIGCGIGGLRWANVEGILLALCELHPATDLIVYTLPNNRS